MLATSAAATGFVLFESYRQSANSQIMRAEDVVARSCRDIGERYAFVVAGWQTVSPVASLSRPGGNVTGVVSGFVTGPMVTMTAGWATFPLPPRSLNPSVKGLAGRSAVG